MIWIKLYLASYMKPSNTSSCHIIIAYSYTIVSCEMTIRGIEEVMGAWLDGLRVEE